MAKILKATGLFYLLILFLSIYPAMAFEPMLPQVYTAETPVAGWWMSEKLDGIRGYWDGSQLYSKNGTLLAAPKEFTAELPPFPLEGELWGGRGTFEQTSSIVMRHQPHKGWLTIHFAIFDVPSAPGPFRQRLLAAHNWFEQRPSPYAFVIEQIPVDHHEQLVLELNRIEALGGEGLIIRDPDAPYQAGRRPHILKVKHFSDAEATVLAHLPGQGRNVGRLGALLVRNGEGIEFRIGSGLNDKDRANPPAIGTVISYKYHGYYQSGIPKFPSYLRIRSDQGL
ncbi:MAG TPA: DNA ligase [Pelovirga sp.]|nr:DNA ligase [Pelovirga sp.]